MSGIVGVFNPDGEQVDPELLQSLTSSLTFRGPDAQEVWLNLNIGFGHAMLRAGQEPPSERQPFSIDGELWITADARVDRRQELISKLIGKGTKIKSVASDAELILQAYQVWREECVQHIVGDFAFAIWDGPDQSLFCARDHFGVKPFYYSKIANRLVFSNTLNCVRAHPGVSDSLNDLAIGDFLVHGFNQVPGTTSFRDVQRLPPGHYLKCSAAEFMLKRYWTLPQEEPIEYRESHEYVQHFIELFERAVADRLRATRASVLMSGGMDSSAVAAMALKQLKKNSPAAQLHGFTAVYDRLIPDQERHYASVVAGALGIPIHFQVLDEYGVFESWKRPFCPPEPPDDATAAIDLDLFERAAALAPVILTGHGGDPIFLPSASSVWRSLKSEPVVRLMASVGKYVVVNGRLPRIGLRSSVKKRSRVNGKSPSFPSWLNKSFADRLLICDRPTDAEPVHSFRPDAYENLTSPYWPHVFEGYDSASTSVLAEFRHPLFDLNLVRYVLRVPQIQWCVDKRLLRDAMGGILPKTILNRPKTPLSVYPLPHHFRQERGGCSKIEVEPELMEYVEKDAMQQLILGKYDDRLWINVRPISLNFWLQRVRHFAYKEASREVL